MMKDYILDLDKPRELRFGYKALRLIRQRLGERSIQNLMNMPIDEMPVFAWAGMKWDDSQLTVERVETLLDDAIPKKYTVVQATEIIISAMGAHLGIEMAKKAPADASKTEPKAAEKKEPTKTIPSKKTKKQP